MRCTDDTKFELHGLFGSLPVAVLTYVLSWTGSSQVYIPLCLVIFSVAKALEEAAISVCSSRSPEGNGNLGNQKKPGLTQALLDEREDESESDPNRVGPLQRLLTGLIAGDQDQ